MDPIYQQALSGTLSNAGAGSVVGDITMNNNTEVPVSISYPAAPGQYVTFATVAVGGTATAYQCSENTYIIVRSALTGAFMAVLTVTTGILTYPITCALLCSPNDIGTIPTPTLSIPIPTDSPSVLVACGVLPNGNTVTRAQYWSRQPDSYSLAPGETRTVSYTEVAGMQRSSSTQETVTAAVSSSASAGWGPISASVSASLSASAMTNQQVSVSTENTSFTSMSLTNTSTTDSSLVLRWQLMDVLTILSTAGVPLASIVSGQAPTVALAYTLNNLPDVASVRTMSPGLVLQPPRVMHAPAPSRAEAKKVPARRRRPARSPRSP
jgi:hypothetical protein